MAKMGYKSGDSLGKSNTNGIVEPLSIEVEKSLSHTKKKHPGLGRKIDPKQTGNVIQDVKIQKESLTKLAFILDFQLLDAVCGSSRKDLGERAMFMPSQNF